MKVFKLLSVHPMGECLNKEFGIIFLGALGELGGSTAVYRFMALGQDGSNYRYFLHMESM